MAKNSKYDQQFKKNAVRYRLDHPEFPLQKAAENLGSSVSALKTWIRATREHEESVPTRGSGNYSSDEAKEIAHLQRELRDTKDALEILKKPSVSWENDRGCLYTATTEYIIDMEHRPVKHRVSVSEVLKRLGISRSGYHAWKKGDLSVAEKYRGEIQETIRHIYEDSLQNYGAPKITRELWKTGEKIAVKTVANYMRQMGIKAQWVKSYIQTTVNSDFSTELHNILNEQFSPDQPDAVWVSDITYIWTFDGFVCLTSIMDLYSRKIIAWVLSETLESLHVVECIEKAKVIRRITRPLIIQIECVSTY